LLSLIKFIASPINPKQAYNDLVGNNSVGTIWKNNNVTVGAASYTKLSFLRTYFDSKGNKIFPFLTAIINVDKGVVTGITWDDSCVFCAKQECEEITFDYNGELQTQATSGQPSKGCYIPNDVCLRGKADGPCNLSLYVVWTGTDAANRAFQSSQSRFGAFPAQDIQDRLSQLVPDIPSLTGRRV